jgi:hypothetical protein
MYPNNLFHLIFAIFSTLCVVFTGIKCSSLVNLSTTTMMESCCFTVMGSVVIKSVVTASHFHYGMGNDYNRPVGCL